VNKTCTRRVEHGFTLIELYVASIGTSVDGAVSVTLSSDAALTAAGIGSSVLTLCPAKSDRTALAATSATVGSTQVFQWVCDGSGTTAALLKYLPGSGRG
jgi:hypothetical protein